MSEKNLYANEDPMGNPYADVDEEEEGVWRSHRLSIKRLMITMRSR